MAHRSRNVLVETGLLVLLSLLWGASFTLTDIAVATIPPATIVLGRLTIGSGLLMAVVVNRKIPLPRSSRRWGALFMQGIVQSALPFTLISWGQQFIDSGLAGLLNTTPPIFVFLIGYLLLRDREAGAGQLFGIVAGLAGILVILGPAALAGESSSVMGQLAVTGASLSYAIAALWAKQFADQPPVLTAACSMAFAAFLMLPLSLWLDEPFRLRPTCEAIGAVVALGVFSTAIAMTIYFRLVRTLGPLAVTNGSYMRAGFSVLLGVLILGGTVSTSLVLGLLLIFAGVAVVSSQINAPSSPGR